MSWLVLLFTTPMSIHFDKICIFRVSRVFMLGAWASLFLCDQEVPLAFWSAHEKRDRTLCAQYHEDESCSNVLLRRTVCSTGARPSRAHKKEEKEQYDSKKTREKSALYFFGIADQSHKR
nr:hypothetical protein [Pandoravirus massiliensis]